MPTVCYCGSSRPFNDCCSPFINGLKTAPSAEALMRSRYSAYASGAMEYVLNTYATKQRSTLSLQDLQNDNTHWCKLDVVNAKEQGEKAQVEFCAYSQEGNNYFLLHELSDFCKEDGQWRYVQGHIYADSGAVYPNHLKMQDSYFEVAWVYIKRNDVCLCNSGKKFKKCCGLK